MKLDVNSILSERQVLLFNFSLSKFTLFILTTKWKNDFLLQLRKCSASKITEMNDMFPLSHNQYEGFKGKFMTPLE